MSSPFAGGSPFKGRRIGKYELIEELGEGGMSRVFKALDTHENREVALKIVYVGNTDGREKAEVERRGSTLQKKLSEVDPHIPHVYEVGEADGYFYVAMEIVEGEDLTDLIGQMKLDVVRSVGIVSDICEVLEETHSFSGDIEGRQVNGIVHGDIKPGNIRITPDKKTKVFDFGIAKALSEFGKSTTNNFASRPYSSPERLKTGRMDSLSDLWSVGVVLHEMVVGNRPFHGDDNEELEEDIRSGRLIQFKSHSPIPYRLQRIIAKALAPNPEMRYATATSFKEDLHRFQRGAKPQAELDNFDDYELRSERFNEPPTERTNTPRVADAYEGWREPDSEPTRRTDQPGFSPPVSPPTHNKTNPVNSKGPFSRTVKRGLLAVVILVVLGLVANELQVLGAATQLKNELISEQLRNMDEAWNRYDSLKSRSVLTSLGISPARRPLREKLIAQADWVFKDYRNNGSPAVKESDWQDAQRHLTRALEIEPDNVVTSSLRYAEGHVHRINGMAKLGSNLQDAKKAFNNAVNLFLESAALNPEWPDPHLGLLAVYAYGLRDPGKVKSETEKLKSLNADPGTRGTATLADASWRNANEMFVKAAAVSDCKQKIDIYEKARDGYSQAIELYRQIITFGNAAKNLNYAQTRLTKCDQILEVLRPKCSGQE